MNRANPRSRRMTGGAIAHSEVEKNAGDKFARDFREYSGAAPAGTERSMIDDTLTLSRHAQTR